MSIYPDWLLGGVVTAPAQTSISVLREPTIAVSARGKAGGRAVTPGVSAAGAAPPIEVEVSGPAVIEILV